MNTLLERQGELTPAGVIPAKPEALILAPTRELALQICKEATAYGSGSMVRIRVVYGGTTLGSNRAQLAVRLLKHWYHVLLNARTTIFLNIII